MQAEVKGEILDDPIKPTSLIGHLDTKRSATFFARLRQYRMPIWLLMIVALPVFMAFLLTGLQLYTKFSVQAYPEGDISITPFAQEIQDYDYISQVYTHSDYSLPLAKLPDNYESVRDHVLPAMTHDDMVLLLRNGFVEIPHANDSASVSTIYEELLQLGLPLLVTQDSVLAYAESAHTKVKNEADVEVSQHLAEFLGHLSDEAYTRSKRGSTEMRRANLDNALTLYSSLQILSPDTSYPDELAGEIEDRLQKSTMCSDAGGNKCFLAALNFLEDEYSSTSDSGLRMRIIWAGMLKNDINKDSWIVLSSYLAFFYPEYHFFEIGSVDDVVKSTVGYRADEKALLGERVVETLKEKIEDAHSVEPQFAVQSHDVLAIASELGISKACELKGVEDGSCLHNYDKIDAHALTYGNLEWWISSSMISESDSDFYTFHVSSGWRKKNVGSALGFAMPEGMISETAEGVVDEGTGLSEPGNGVIPETSPIFLDPNPELYSRIEYETKLLSMGLRNLDVLSTDNETFLSELEIDMHTLALLSKKILAGTGVTEEENGELREILGEILESRMEQNSNTKSMLLLAAIRGTEGALFLAAGPSVQYSPVIENTVGNDTVVEEEQAKLAAIQSFFDWHTIAVNNANFDEPYDKPVVAQAAGTVRIPVLMYHQIAVSPTTTLVRRLYVPPDIFEQQLAYLAAENYRSLTPQEFFDILATGQNPPQKSVMLTFDDSVSNHYTVAFPLLKKYGFVGVFYVVSHKSGITTAQLKEMADAGMIIDSHSESHRDLTKLDDASLLEEIAGSKSALEAVTGKKIVSMCYPGCVVDDRGIGMVAGSGYSLGFSCGKAIDHVYKYRYVLSRIHVYDDMDNFQKIFSGIWEIPASYYQ